MGLAVKLSSFRSAISATMVFVPVMLSQFESESQREKAAEVGLERFLGRGASPMHIHHLYLETISLLSLGVYG